ncbi:hypothetical protein PQQ81_14830 [Paraburkholderia strydomiana]
MDSFNPDDVAIRSGHFIGGEYVEGVHARPTRAKPGKASSR